MSGKNKKQKTHQGKPRANEASSHEEGGARQELVASLAELEACLESPVVPGELLSWGSGIQKSIDALETPLSEELNVNHPAEFAEISEEDPEMLRQVEQLREEDAHVLDLFEIFSHKLHRFRELAEHAEPNEGKLDVQIKEVVEHGLELVISIRKQQQALKTWLVEAFQRDTGFGD